MNESFMDTRAAGAFLGLSPSTLNSMRVRGGGPAFHKFGRAVRYSMADLREFARQTRAESTENRRGRSQPRQPTLPMM